MCHMSDDGRRWLISLSRQRDNRPDGRTKMRVTLSLRKVRYSTLERSTYYYNNLCDRGFMTFTSLHRQQQLQSLTNPNKGNNLCLSARSKGELWHNLSRNCHQKVVIRSTASRFSFFRILAETCFVSPVYVVFFFSFSQILSPGQGKTIIYPIISLKPSQSDKSKNISIMADKKTKPYHQGELFRLHYSSSSSRKTSWPCSS